MRYILLTLSLLLMVGCNRLPEPSSDGATTKLITIPGQKTPRAVLFNSKQSADCSAIRERLSEIMNSVAGPNSIDGLSYKDVKGSFSSYRAYYLDEQVKSADEAAFVICQGVGSGLVPAGCRLFGITQRGCYDTGIYAIANASGIQSIVNAIRQNWPQDL